MRIACHLPFFSSFKQSALIGKELMNAQNNSHASVIIILTVSLFAADFTGAQLLNIETATIPGNDYEINGPTYTYEIGKYEITNAEYCVFLNNAEFIQQTNPADSRCTYMYFLPVNGNVYTTIDANYSKTDQCLYWTSDFESKIKYNSAQPIGNRYYVLPDYQQHPVGNISWMGAAKFCNWLTIDSGMNASDLCYHEGLLRTDWYIITASDWSTNGVSDSERLTLVRDYKGYRLPMDGRNYGNGGPGVATSWNMDATPYNEWYKAAAFDPAAPDIVRTGPGDDEEVQPDHWIFAAGVNVITPADANLGNNGYTFPSPLAETTPVGFYNGINTLYDGTITNDTQNRYGLYDMCGNVAEWSNDTSLESPWTSQYRVVRGGRWVTSDPKWASASIRVSTINSYCAENNIGFRIARSFGYGDFNGDNRVNLDDYAFFAAAMTGPRSTITPGFGYEACDYNGDNHIDLTDFTYFQMLFGSSD